MKKQSIILILTILISITLIPSVFACGPDGEPAEIVEDVIICENQTATIHLTNPQYTIDDGEISVYIGDTCMANGKVKNNTAIINPINDTNCPEPGNYTGTISFTNSKIFIDEEKTVTIIVPEHTKSSTTITDEQLNCDNGQTYVHIQAEDNTTINEGIIRVYIGDTCMANGRVINNTALVKQQENITTCPPGNYTAIITFDETYNYQNTTKQLTVIVPEHNTLPQVLIIENEIKTTNNNITIHLQAENNNTIDCGIITLTINNKKYTSNVENNQATIENLNLNEGTYNGTINYNCNNQHYQNTTKKITLLIENLKININNLNKTYLENKNLTGNINTNTQQTINIKITRLSNNLSKTYTVTTNINGEFSLPINLATGQYTIEAQTENTTTQAQIQINKAETIIQTNNYTNTQTDKNFKGQLKTTNTQITNQNIQLKITRLSNNLSKTYTVTTNINGEFSLPINLATGHYIIETIYSGTNNYKSTQNTNTVTII